MPFNPFETRFWLPGVLPFEFDTGTGREDLIAKINRFPVLQVVGPHGSGKSTLLESLADLFVRECGLVRRAFLRNDRQTLPNDFLPKRGDEKTLFLLDGYEQLSLHERFWLRMRPWQKTAGLVLTTHRPALFIPILYKTKANFERFRRQVEQLTRNSDTHFDRDALEEIFRQADGNFRTAFFELYDRCEP